MAGKYSLLTTAQPKRLSPPISICARWPKGCQGGVMNALALGISTLILNIAIACWLSAAEGFNHNLVVLQRRSCSSSRKITISCTSRYQYPRHFANGCVQLLHADPELPTTGRSGCCSCCKEVDVYWCPEPQESTAYTLDATFALSDFSYKLLAGPPIMELGNYTRAICK